MASSTAYFLSLDYTTLLPQLLADGGNTGARAVARLIETVTAVQLNDQQESTLLDVLLRVI